MLPRSWLALAVTLGCAWPLPLRSCSSTASQFLGPPRAAAPARFSLKLGRCAGLAGSASVAGLDSETGRGGAGQSDSSRIGAVSGDGSCGEGGIRVLARVARLRGGGKGGCKAKHLSRVTEGRRKMVEKHSHRNLLLGSQYNGTVAAARILDARSPNWVAQPTKKRDAGEAPATLSIPSGNAWLSMQGCRVSGRGPRTLLPHTSPNQAAGALFSLLFTPCLLPGWYDVWKQPWGQRSHEPPLR